MHTDPLGPVLLALARQAIEARLGLPASVSPTHPRLAEPGATFVTLTRHGQLRGCIGSLEAWRPLGQDVADNAQAAAFRDPRFPPMDLTQWRDTRVEVSLLSAPETLACHTENELLAKLEPGQDGLIFNAGSRRATFLPQVWEQLPAPQDFLEHLRRKAGLPGNYWGPEVQCQRYRVEKWKEGALP